ncbi:MULTISPECIES: hypothetical protein [unclassified Mesorhizobium]|nr:MULTISPECIES: hypothetical protein [unclassified Mesorhizobium]
MIHIVGLRRRGPTPDERRIGFGVAAEEKGGGGLMVVIDVS